MSIWNQLLQLTRYPDFPILAKNLTRLTNILGEQNTVKTAKEILINGKASELQNLSDQQIKQRFVQKFKSDTKSNSTIPFSDKLNPEKAVPKKPSEEIKQDQKSRIKRQMNQNLAKYGSFTSLAQKNIDQIINMTYDYLKTSQLISRRKISQKAMSLRNKTINSSKQTFLQYLQMVDSAFYQSSKGKRLRSPQIMALILYLYINKNGRIILQIDTGEGKSSVIACLAAMLTISGKTVDVVTTNQLLAKRDVEEKKSFYELMNLNVCHNFQQNQQGPKSCYEGQNIVYGTPHSFQADILYDQYKKKKTRCGRSFSVLIVDQSDSMFIDQKENQTLLGSTFPGFSQLIHPMKIIWNRISSFPIFKDQKNIKMVIPTGKDQGVVGQARQIMNQVIADVRKQFQNQIIPQWRMDFIYISLDNWIESAIKAAFCLKQNEDYMVKNNKIVIVDAKNTGAIQQNSQWQKGLHQFLQIKHGVEVTIESLTSNFISNLGHFDKYSCLYGLTGTLGSQQSKNYLRETFSVQMMRVAPFKQKRLIIDEGKVLYDEIQWAKYIIEQISQMQALGRSVLLLCQSIHETDLIKIAIQGKLNLKAIQFYTTGEQNIRDQIDCRELIVATNLAGRGTDFKVTQKLNKNGGLHVIIGFLPTNLRVEMQGRGRAGRNGCEGSSELAINYKRFCTQFGLNHDTEINFYHSEWSSPKTWIYIRDKIQKTSMQNDRETVKKLRDKDKIFKIYCDGMSSIPDFQENPAKQKALQERFAMQLLKAEQNKVNTQQTVKDTKILVQDMVQNSQFYYNPNHQILRGVNQMCNNNIKSAVQHFSKAEKISNKTIKIAAKTYKYSCRLNENPQDKKNINECLKGFAQAKVQIKKKIELSKGLGVYDTINKKIVNHHQQQRQNRQLLFQQKLKNQKKFTPTKLESKLSQINIKNDINPPPNIDLESGQQRVFNGLNDHLQEIQNKFRNLKKDEFIKMDYKPISDILDFVKGDKEQNEKALQKLRNEGFHHLPVPKVYTKKKKVPWWKRALVFVLGVAQCIIGAVIIASTAGALSGFGLSMMIEGTKQCYDAIFRPQQLQDLSKYYGKVVLSYTFSLALSGLKGIKQLGSLGQKGFTMFKNMPIKQFLSTTLSNAGKGLGMAAGVMASLNGGGKVLLSKGLACGTQYLLNDNENRNLRQMIKDPVIQIKARKDDLSQKVNKIIVDENLKDRNIQQIKSKFDTNMTSIIRRMIQELDPRFITQIKKIQMKQEEVYHLISNFLKKNLELPKSRSPQARQIVNFFKKQIDSPRLAQRFSEKINLLKLIKNSIQSLKDNKLFNSLIEKNIQQKVINSLKLISQQKKQIIQNKKDQLDKQYKFLENKNCGLTVSSYNQRVEAFNQNAKANSAQIDKFNQFQESLKNFKDIWETLKQRNMFDKFGKIQVYKINQLPFNQYTKQALRRVEYKICSGSIEQSVENAVYNEVVNYGQIIIDNIHQYQGDLSKRVKQVEDQINK